MAGFETSLLAPGQGWDDLERNTFSHHETVGERRHKAAMAAQSLTGCMIENANIDFDGAPPPPSTDGETPSEGGQ